MTTIITSEMSKEHRAFSRYVFKPIPKSVKDINILPLPSFEFSLLPRSSCSLSALSEILPLDLSYFLERVADFAEVVAVADLDVESLHFSQQLARVTFDGYVDLGPTGRMRRRVKHSSPESLPLRAVQVRDNDGDDLSSCVLDLRRSSIVRFEMRHNLGRLVVLAVHFPWGGTVSNRKDAVVGKVRIAHEGRLARDPTQQHTGYGMR